MKYNIGKHKLFKSLPNDKTLDLTKLKACADDKRNMTEKLKFDMKLVENIVGKGENAGYQTSGNNHLNNLNTSYK